MAMARAQMIAESRRQMSVQVEKEYALCGLSIRPAAMALTGIQVVLALGLGISNRLLLDDASSIMTIVLCIHLFCAALAGSFLAFIFLGRKYGSLYEVILHAHLLGILLMALTSLFCLMYLPLSFLQKEHSFNEGVHWLLLSIGALIMFSMQFIQKSTSEQMLPHIEHTFRE